jgi:uncharacterized protein (DUF1800 family)
MTNKSYIAAYRFGMGVDPKDISIINKNPQKWVLSQLEKPMAHRGFLSDFASSKELEIKVEAATQSKNSDQIKTLRQEYKKLHFEAIKARLTYFWSNHFAVSVRKPDFYHLAFNFEKEAIRPNIFGKFEDLLLNVVAHPAMLIYLDNINSTGPNSTIGKRKSVGLNENLAREILELHTLGVGGGYKQKDVIALAKLITGWTVSGGEFQFNPEMHEPTDVEFLGVVYKKDDNLRGIKALRYIAQHPSTAHFVSKKLVRHFCPGKEVPENAHKTIRAVLLNSKGDLQQIYQAIANLKEAWDTKRFRVKNNQDFIIALGKAVNIKPNIKSDYYFNSYKSLGEEPFNATSPQGYLDDDNVIASGEIMKSRIEMAILLAKNFSFNFKPADLAREIIGEMLSGKTKNAIFSARNDWQAYSFLLASPEFQKR